MVPPQPPAPVRRPVCTLTLVSIRLLPAPHPLRADQPPQIALRAPLVVSSPRHRLSPSRTCDSTTHSRSASPATHRASLVHLLPFPFQWRCRVNSREGLHSSLLCWTWQLTRRTTRSSYDVESSYIFSSWCPILRLEIDRARGTERDCSAPLCSSMRKVHILGVISSTNRGYEQGITKRATAIINWDKIVVVVVAANVTHHLLRLSCLHVVVRATGQ